ncbi:prolyl oligopeptidase family serine peptidase [Microbacterium sp. GXS0129]|uniref:prolyl oligopeptidase family serine peptidase n=1 Tax=Microbacterium sp. GXS0129 TaxID=3377836 RepID=UPI00383AF9E5
MSETLPYGTWPSIITAADVAAAAPRYDGAAFVGSEVWWAQSIPSEGGRMAVFRDGADTPLLPAPWSAGSRVHEYGGGAWAADEAGQLFFVEKSDQRVYRFAAGGDEPTPLTPIDPAARFGGLRLQRGRLLAVREVHTSSPVPERDVVDIPLDGSAVDDPAAVTSLATGSDFVACPTISPDGTRLAWIAWSHPSMPWDAAEARVGILGADGVHDVRTVSRTCATQVAWTAAGSLLFTDDPTGRWNLYLTSPDDDAPRAVAPADADTGGPLWVLGSRWFAALDDGRIVAVRTNGTDELVLITGDHVQRVPLPLTSDVHIEDVDGSRILVSGSSATIPTGFWVIDVDENTAPQRVAGGVLPWDPSWLPVSRQVSFSGERGEIHAFDYPPTHPSATAPAGERPPYVVLAHGGPTSHVSGGVSSVIAYFTSRGIGVLDVNYGGSTGYGRAYRERLAGAWGIVDIDDVLNAASSFAATGAADPERLAVKGGSAGGLTVYGALERGSTFSAGISRYGVADLRTLATDTHDFEARYLDGLIGRFPDDEDVYIERSPLTHADRIAAPVLILQGADDPVVPPSQSEMIRDALAERGVPHAYVLYPGESHGFRSRETVIDATERELAFLAAAWGFDPDGIAPLSFD